MGLEANKDIVRQYFRALCEGRIDDVEQLITKDTRWTVPTAGDLDWPVVRGILLMMFGKVQGPDAMKIVGLTAEGDRVAAEVVSNLKVPDGRIFRTSYHILYIIRDGRIAEVKEYFDTAYAEKMFGSPARWPAAS